MIISALQTLMAQAKMIAHYPMKDSPINLVDDSNYQNLKICNGSFINQALYSKGEYGDFEKNEGSMISTPPMDALDLGEFTISVYFKVNDYAQMPVFVLGWACRLLNFGLENDGKISLLGNNGNDILETKLTYQPNTWYLATIIYQADEGKAQIYLDAQFGGELKLVFKDECLDKWRRSNTDISSVNFSNGSCFQGFWRDLKVYNGIQIPTETDKPIVINRQPALIEWQSPEKTTSVSKSNTYDLKACVKSATKITTTELLVNGVLQPSPKMRGFEVVKAETCEAQIEQKITLQNGKNEILLIVQNSAGISKSKVNIQYEEEKPIEVNTEPMNQKIQKFILNTNQLKPYVKKHNYEYYSPIISPDKNNGAYIGWKDQNKQLHISQINAQNQVIKDFKIADDNSTLFALCTDDNGFAALIVRQVVKNMDWIYFVKFDKNGTKLIENKLIGDADFNKEGNRAFSDWSTPRLAFNGQEYMAFFGISRKWNDGVVHQGDIGLIIDKTGKIDTRKSTYTNNQYVIMNGFEWGSSHSFEQRLIFDGLYFHTLAKGDAYPRGLAYGRILSDIQTKKNIKTIGKKTIFEASGKIGENYVPLALGGLVSTGTDGECVLSFVSNENRGSYDLGFIKIDQEGNFEQKWLTNTPNLDENNSYMAKYGDNYFIAWTALNSSSQDPLNELDDFKAMVVNNKGEVVIPPFDLSAQFQRRYIVHESRWYNFKKSYEDFNMITNDFINFSNGDIGWVWTNAENQIEIIRFKL